jgi:hypothetical protein
MIQSSTSIPPADDAPESMNMDRDTSTPRKKPKKRPAENNLDQENTKAAGASKTESAP